MLKSEREVKSNSGNWKTVKWGNDSVFIRKNLESPLRRNVFLLNPSLDYRAEIHEDLMEKGEEKLGSMIECSILHSPLTQSVAGSFTSVPGVCYLAASKKEEVGTK